MSKTCYIKWKSNDTTTICFKYHCSTQQYVHNNTLYYIYKIAVSFLLIKTLKQQFCSTNVLYHNITVVFSQEAKATITFLRKNYCDINGWACMIFFWRNVLCILSILLETLLYIIIFIILIKKIVLHYLIL